MSNVELDELLEKRGTIRTLLYYVERVQELENQVRCLEYEVSDYHEAIREAGFVERYVEVEQYAVNNSIFKKVLEREGEKI